MRKFSVRWWVEDPQKRYQEETEAYFSKTGVGMGLRFIPPKKGKPLSQFKAGDRVYRPDSTRLNVNFLRNGTVIKECGTCGVKWDGIDAVYEYTDTLFLEV